MILHGGDSEGARRQRGGGEEKQDAISNIALFLGAGASAPYGMPTTVKLRGKLTQGFPRQDLINSDQFPDAEHILQALDDEIHFAKTAAGMYHCKDATFNNKIKHSGRAKNYVENLVRLSYIWKPSMDAAAADILGAFFELARSDSGDITVFTTNYDGAIEEYCGHEDRATECIDGFEPHRASREHVWRENFAPSDESAHSRVFLYKLHGSMNWQRRTVSGTREVVRKPDGSIPANRSDDVYIRPTLDNKDVDMLEEPFATLRDKFDNLLESFDACIVIGCSFRDKHILDKFIEFIKSGKILIAVSPTAAADFWTALKKPLASTIKNEWEKTHLCSMSYKQGGADGFYAVHKKLGKDNTKSIINAIISILEESASPSRIGFVANVNK